MCSGIRLSSLRADNVIYTKRYKVLWGGGGLTKATLDAMRRLLEAGPWDFFINLRYAQ